MTVTLQLDSLPLYVLTVTQATPGFIAVKLPFQFVLVILTTLLLLVRKVLAAQPLLEGMDALSVALCPTLMIILDLLMVTFDGAAFTVTLQVDSFPL